MDIRQLQYLAALAREKHFTRAAAACNVSQPTLSGRIRQLEQELGVPIVERGQRFHGLTAEGERVLKWAQTILDDWQAMQQELQQIKGRKESLTGKLVLGVVPSALPMVAQLTRRMMEKHAGVDFTVLSHSTEEILRGLNDFSLDVGIAYLDNEPIDGLVASPLYMERYCLFVGETTPSRPATGRPGSKRRRSRCACSRPTCRTGASSTARSARPTAIRPRGSRRTPSSTCGRTSASWASPASCRNISWRRWEPCDGLKAIPLTRTGC